MSYLNIINRAVCNNQSMLRLLGSCRMVHHRTNSDKKTSISDFDDGYYYRNGEERYAQTLRNRQAALLRFDDIYYKMTRNKRVFNKTHIDFPNCTCAEDLEAYEKSQAKLPRSETAAPMKDYTRLHHL